MKQIETERLLLREWTLGDAEACFKYAKNPNVGPHAGWKPHESVEESEKIIETVFLPADAWAVALKQSGEIIGCIGLEADKHRPDIASRELGYWLAEEYWGGGLMTEAARAVLQYAFTELKLQVAAVCTGPENRRSQSVIAKCGFQFEGTIRCAYKTHDGTLRDTRCYSLLLEEWKEGRSALQSR